MEMNGNVKKITIFLPFSVVTALKAVDTYSITWRH